MAINYSEIKSATALRLAQLQGTSQSTLETAYTAYTLDGAEIPASGLKDAILSIERELVQLIGNNAQHPARSLLYGRSVDLSDLDSTPTQDQTGAEFFGIFDSCADADNFKPCTWQPTQTISDIVDGGSTFFSDTDFYYYNITGNYIRTTRSSVFLQGVAWSYDLQEAAYDADQDSPLPQGLTPVWLDGIAARAAQVGWIAGDLFGYYNNLYQVGRQNFNQLGTMPNLPLTAAANLAAG